MNTTFSKASLPKSGVYAVPVFAGTTSKAFKQLDKQSKGALTRAMSAGDFTGKTGQILEILGPVGHEKGRVVLLGAGDAKKFSNKEAIVLGAKASAKYLRSGEKALVFALDGFSSDCEENALLWANIAYGAKLRAYGFDKYRTTQEKSEAISLNKISINGEDALDAKKAFADLEKIAEGVFLTRDLVSEPANKLYPDSFAKRVQELDALGVKVEILGEKQMQKLGMWSLLGVGQGSAKESKLAIMKWMGGDKDQKPVCFVGKGVTFDSGGISLKPGAGMWDMKFDMGGAGAVTGAMAALAGRKAKANVIGIIGLVENMPDADAQRPSDVVTSMSGQTIEVQNTDAEGRLVLADALTYAQEKFTPQMIIDLATLTGAIIMSLAHDYAGLFSNDDELSTQILAAGKAVDEELWKMPLTKAHHDMIKSDIADMKNIGGKFAGSSTAAAFLEKFIKKGTPWAHLDIAGTAWNYTDGQYAPKGGSGYGVRLLDEIIRKNYES
ncbi:MAG: leucyl aminopeptidase [bacterium]